MANIRSATADSSCGEHVGHRVFTTTNFLCTAKVDRLVHKAMTKQSPEARISGGRAAIVFANALKRVAAATVPPMRLDARHRE
jgi:hypothetical protein